ncbi:polysaccharide synthase [Xylariaceae sp. FL0804]|nr:polysaccharide synthase [Xylariaceae sp. FL0804]
MSNVSDTHWFWSRLGPLILILYWVWGRLENRYHRRHLLAYKPFVSSGSADDAYRTQDVSVIACILRPREDFEACLATWLRNRPRELIIVTASEQQRGAIRSAVREVEQQQQQRSLDDSSSSSSGSSLSTIVPAVPVSVLVAERQGKRPQLAMGIRAVEEGSSLIAIVDDGVWWQDGFLEHMLPCFEDPAVGAAGPPISVHIPPHRRTAAATTAWEAAGARVQFRRTPGLKTAWQIARWCWVLTGLSCVCRAEVLRDERFLEAYCHDAWLGHERVDAGDDTFLSRWLQRRGWRIAVQDVPQTEVFRAVRRDRGGFARQMFRWERSTIQTMLRSLWEVPQVWRDVYVARKTLERVFRPLITSAHVLGWALCLRDYPRLACLIICYYVFETAPSYVQFLSQYPFMGRHLWAIVLVDYFYIVQDVWCWLTLGDVSWHH